MASFIDSWKKEKQKAKMNRKVSEQESDPISFLLYCTLCFETLARSLNFLGLYGPTMELYGLFYKH